MGRAVFRELRRARVGALNAPLTGKDLADVVRWRACGRAKSAPGSCYISLPRRTLMEMLVAIVTSARSSHRNATNRREIEWRFDAPDLSKVEGWLAGRDRAPSGGVSVDGGGTKRLSDT